MLDAKEWNAASELYVLRIIDANGPLSGGELDRELRPLAIAARRPQPVFPLLHRLTEAGWLSADADQLPKRYAVTDAGRAGAEALIAGSPRVSDYFQNWAATAQTVLGATAER